MALGIGGSALAQIHRLASPQVPGALRPATVDARRIRERSDVLPEVLVERERVSTVSWVPTEGSRAKRNREKVRECEGHKGGVSKTLLNPFNAETTFV